MDRRKRLDREARERRRQDVLAGTEGVDGVRQPLQILDPALVDRRPDEVHGHVTSVATTTMTAAAPTIIPRARRPPSRAPFTGDTVSETALRSGLPVVARRCTLPIDPRVRRNC